MKGTVEKKIDIYEYIYIRYAFLMSSVLKMTKISFRNKATQKCVGTHVAVTGTAKIS